MDKNPAAGDAHVSKIQEYLDKGYARKLTPEEAAVETNKTWYRPHFVIAKPHKPGKFRLVFDAAAKVKGKCLNDFLLTGPDLLNQLPAILLKFRQGKVAFSGDIRDMFHQVRVAKEDLPSQRFLWRGRDRSRPPDVYEMLVLVFGEKSSPTATIYVTHKNAEANQQQFPEAAEAIKSKHYMDDYLDSKGSVGDALRIIQDVTEVHQRGGFEITGWVSNSRELMAQIPEEERGGNVKSMEFDTESNVQRVLGLHWDTKKDVWTFNSNFEKIDPEVLNGSKPPTKREILGVIMSVFDPLGFAAHFTIKGKMIMQEVWRRGLGWDDELSGEVLDKWKLWIEELHSISSIQIPRCYSPWANEGCKMELHVFGDGSEEGYCAVAYLRVVHGDEVSVRLVMAKSRVASLKAVSIPRQELLAAVMGVRIAATIKRELELKIEKTVFWADSSTVLSWVRTGDSRRYKQFVAHRVGEILESTEGTDWRYVPTNLNPADDGTRSGKLSDFDPEGRWYCGPEFLKKSPEEWPQDKSLPCPSGEELEVKAEFVGNASEKIQWLPDPERFSFLKLMRITAYIKRIASKQKPKTLAIRATELEGAEVVWWKFSQMQSFPEELALLEKGKVISKSSRLYRLHPVLDEKGVIRLGGRIGKADFLDWGTKAPVILDPKNQFVVRLMDHYHQQHEHQGQEAVFNDMRRKYWVLDMRANIKKTWRRCQKCSNGRAQPVPPIMGELPLCRLAADEPPFTFTGLDYFGPVEVTVKRRTEKRWVALFVCMTTGAVHVEIARHIDTSEAINAIRKFMSIRGRPKMLYSDNGTNFRGAEAELKRAISEWDHEKIDEELAPKGTEWHFIPAHGAHMGGLWERMVKAIKTVLKSSLGCRTPAEEVFEVFLKEAADIVNSRPLSHVSTDPQDPRSITPNDILRPGALVVETPGVFGESDHFCRRKWRNAQIMVDHFWSRWKKECLPGKIGRSKWHEENDQVKIGDVVLVVDDLTPRNRWKLGIVVAVHPGADGVVRAVTVKSGKKEKRRPVIRLCQLDARRGERPQGSFGGDHVASSHLSAGSLEKKIPEEKEAWSEQTEVRQ